MDFKPLFQVDDTNISPPGLWNKFPEIIEKKNANTKNVVIPFGSNFTLVLSRDKSDKQIPTCYHRYITNHIMKPLYLVLAIALLLFVASCKEDGKISEIPKGLTSSTLCPTLAQRLQDLLPEQNCMVLHPILFKDSIQKKIVLTKESEVYVTYISQIALYKNTLGWYSYTSADKAPTDVSKIKREILFPNVTEPPLKAGDRVQIGSGKFPAGTVIEFFLIIQGWKNGVIDYNELTVYTDPMLNPGQLQQHIMFKEKECNNVVLGFEDILQNDTQNPYFDNDFNEAVFTISDNNSDMSTTSFDLAKMAVL